MVRDPRGKYAHTRYNQTWGIDDPKWDDSMLSQIPYPLENTNGIFYVGIDEVFTCFSFLDQASYKKDEGYQNYWYDVDNDPIKGSNRTFTFTPEETDGSIYVSVETYYKNMVPSP